MPNEKKSACSATRSASRAARGSSIIVPTWYSTGTPNSAITASASSTTSWRIPSSSSGRPTRGIITSGMIATPSRVPAQAASKRARTWLR